MSPAPSCATAPASSLSLPWITTGDAPQAPCDVAVIVPSLGRASLAQAVRSVLAQDFRGRIQVLIGLDPPLADPLALRALLLDLGRECPPGRVLTVMDLGYSPKGAGGALPAVHCGGTLRTVLSAAAHADLLTYLDDDCWMAPWHVQSLCQAIEGFDWAYTRRWFVDAASDRIIAEDDFESVGPQSHLDTNTLMIRRSRCWGVIPLWSIPLALDGTGEDRRVVAALRQGHGVGWTNRPSVYYRMADNGWRDQERIRRLKSRGWVPGPLDPTASGSVTPAQHLVRAVERTKRLILGARSPVSGWVATHWEETGNPHVARLDPRQPLPFKDNHLEEIVLVEIDCFTQEQGIEICREAYRVLQEGGTLQVGFFDLRKFAVHLIDQPERSTVDAAVVLARKSLWTEEALARVLQEEGFGRLLKRREGRLAARKT